MKLDESILIIESPPRSRWARFWKTRTENARLAWQSWEVSRIDHFRRLKQEAENRKSFARRYGQVYAERPNEDFPDWGKGGNHVEK